MNYFGIETSFVENKIVVKNGNYQPKKFYVESDWSAATYFYSVAILAEQAEIELIGLTNQNIQGDAVITAIADSFGVETTWKENAVVLNKMRKPDFDSYNFDFIECPDIAQTVVAFCAASFIELNCQGLQTLRIKETDRIAALDNELQKLGFALLLEIDSNNWKLVVNKRTANDKDRVTSIATYEDHRMAMAFAPLCLATKSIVIEEPNVVAKSYPLFWNDLKKLGFSVETI